MERTRPSVEITFVLGGYFGRAVVDTERPGLRELWLRQPHGALAPKNLLGLHSPAMHGWAVGGYSYVVGNDGVRYESRRSRGHRVERTDGRVSLSGVGLVAENGQEAPLTENWEVAITADGALCWRIERRWEGGFTGKFSGAPALFFNSRPNEVDTRTARGNRNERPNLAGNGVITSLWYVRDCLDGFWSLDYFSTTNRKPIEPGKAPAWPPEMFALNPCVTVKDRDAWAVAKLYPSFPLDADLRVGTRGHLYRRGSYDDFSEIGVVASAGQTFAATPGLVETTALTLVSLPKEDTGYKLAVRIPDADAETALRRYYSGLLNGGSLCDMKLHDFGNETDGWRVGFTPHLAAYAIAAGVPAANPVSSKPASLSQALRESLDMRLDALGPDGRLDWGFTHEPGKVLLDCQFSLPLAAEKYWLHTGDLDWLRGRFDELDLATAVMVGKAEANGGLVG